MQKTKTRTVQTHRTFALGVFFLTASNVLTKLCGLFLKVPLTNTLGDTGMAYFNLAYAVYKWFYMISTAGLPVAAAVLTARYASMTDMRTRETMLLRVCRVTLGAFCLLGLIGWFCMDAGSDWFAALQHAPGAAHSIAAIAPAIFMIAVASALRGWYQGLGSLLPASISQVAEAAGKTVFGLLFAVWALGAGMPAETVSSKAIQGLTVGSFFGMLVMMFALLPVSKKYSLPLFGKRMASISAASDTCTSAVLLRRLLRIAIPVTLSASVLSLCDMLDSMIVIRRMTLSAGVSHADALRLYGNYTSLCVPMFNLPPILIYPLTTALVPVLSRANEARRSKASDPAAQTRFSEIVRGYISLAAVVSFPCAAGMAVLSEPILRLFYRPDLAATGAPLLAVLSPATAFLALLAMTNAILQASDGARCTVVSMVCGAVIKLCSSWSLTGQPGIGILGTPISTVLCYAVMASINLAFTVKKTGVGLSMHKLLIRPAVCSLLCAVSAKGIYLLAVTHLPAFAATLTAVGVGGMVYLVTMLLSGGIGADMLRLFR